MVTLAALQFLTNLIFSIIEFFIGLRIILRLFGANQAAPFVNWVYETSGSLLTPFAGIFPNARLQGGFIVDFSALFALLIYSFIHYGINEFLKNLEHQAEHVEERTVRRRR